MKRDLVDVVGFGWANFVWSPKTEALQKRGETRRTYMVRGQNISRLFCRMASVKAFINRK
jgi:hypothetical protein